MEQIFGQLTSAGKNNHNDLTNLIKGADLIDGNKVTEQGVSSLFNAVPNKDHIDYAQFAGILSQVATMTGQGEDTVIGKIIAEAEKLLAGAAAASAVSGGLGALKGFMH